MKLFICKEVLITVKKRSVEYAKLSITVAFNKLRKRSPKVLDTKLLELGLGVNQMSRVPVATSGCTTSRYSWVLHIGIHITLQGRCSFNNFVNLLKPDESLEDR